MIPYLPAGTSDLEIPPFFQQIRENLEMRLAHHESWWTHKRDPSVCPICDTIELAKIVVGELGRIISKSALDLDDQFLESDISSDEGEIDGNSENRPGDN